MKFRNSIVFIGIWAFGRSQESPGFARRNPALQSAAPISFDESSACDFELKSLCGMMQPPGTFEEVLSARMCLYENKANVGSDCTSFLYNSNPSVVEPCFNEISRFCLDIVPGEGRVHSCLYGHFEDLTVRCANALNADSGNSLPLFPNRQDSSDAGSSGSFYGVFPCWIGQIYSSIFPLDNPVAVVELSATDDSADDDFNFYGDDYYYQYYGADDDFDDDQFEPNDGVFISFDFNRMGAPEEEPTGLTDSEEGFNDGVEQLSDLSVLQLLLDSVFGSVDWPRQSSFSADGASPRAELHPPTQPTPPQPIDSAENADMPLSFLQQLAKITTEAMTEASEAFKSLTD